MSTVTDKLITQEQHPGYYSTNSDEISTHFNSSRLMTNSAMVDIPPSSPTASFEPDFRPSETKTRNRLVDKNGDLRVKAMKVPDRTKLYLADLFTTAVDLRWKWVTLLFCMSYVLSWILFGTFWWFMVLTRGDGFCVSGVRT